MAKLLPFMEGDISGLPLYLKRDIPHGDDQNGKLRVVADCA